MGFLQNLKVYFNQENLPITYHNFRHQQLFCDRQIFAIYLFYACGRESSEDPMNVFSSWLFLHRYFSTILIMVTKQLY